MSFENYFPLWNDLNTAQKKLISDHLITQHVLFDHTACEKRNNHSQREHGLYRIITG